MSAAEYDDHLVQRTRVGAGCRRRRCAPSGRLLSPAPPGDLGSREHIGGAPSRTPLAERLRSKARRSAVDLPGAFALTPPGAKEKSESMGIAVTAPHRPLRLPVSRERPSQGPPRSARILVPWGLFGLRRRKASPSCRAAPPCPDAARASICSRVASSPSAPCG